MNTHFYCAIETCPVIFLTDTTTHGQKKGILSKPATVLGGIEKSCDLCAYHWRGPVTRWRRYPLAASYKGFFTVCFELSVRLGY